MGNWFKSGSPWGCDMTAGAVCSALDAGSQCHG